ncbi:MAG: preprotein translocase subunit SecG [Acetatifactor sp.]|nr:preprotein translocase subunit SecG [Acetatifactor sp.]
MGAIRIILSILYILVSVALVILVLMQEGKAQGLGSISGAAESYWGKNKGRSMEGMLVKITKILAVFFLALTVALNLNVI